MSDSKELKPLRDRKPLKALIHIVDEKVILNVHPEKNKSKLFEALINYFKNDLKRGDIILFLNNVISEKKMSIRFFDGQKLVTLDDVQEEKLLPIITEFPINYWSYVFQHLPLHSDSKMTTLAALPLHPASDPTSLSQLKLDLQELAPETSIDTIESWPPDHQASYLRSMIMFEVSRRSDHPDMNDVSFSQGPFLEELVRNITPSTDTVFSGKLRTSFIHNNITYVIQTYGKDLSPIQFEKLLRDGADPLILQTNAFIDKHISTCNILTCNDDTDTERNSMGGRFLY